MPMRPQIDRLPEQVRAALDQRLADDDYGNLVATSAWLRGLGHQIGKSAVGVYAKRLRSKRATSEREAGSASIDGTSRPAIRLGCLDIAVRMQVTATPSVEAAIDTAAKLEAWVLDTMR